MKYCLLLFIITLSYGQTKSLYLESDTLQVISGWVFEDKKQDSLDAICDERGHIKSGSFVINTFFPFSKFVDLPDKTLKIYQDQNIEVWTCARCGRHFEGPVQATPDTTIIWQRK